jgi:general secretion pathway protein D
MALRRVATALLVAGLITAQTAQAQVTLNFVNADIDQVAKAIGAATGKTIIVDPRVKGQLNLVSENAVPEDQALKTLQSALRMQGFALVQDHGVLKVVPEADAKLQGVPTYVGNTPVARGDQVVTQVFVLKNESANNLLPVLRPLISPNNTVAAYPANNSIVVTDYADNVRPRRDRQHRRDAEGVDHRGPAYQLAADSGVERRPARGREAAGEGTRLADHHARQHARRGAAQR